MNKLPLYAKYTNTYNEVYIWHLYKQERGCYYGYNLTTIDKFTLDTESPSTFNGFYKTPSHLGDGKWTKPTKKEIDEMTNKWNKLKLENL